MIEPENKAILTMVLITIGLIACFVPVLIVTGMLWMDWKNPYLRNRMGSHAMVVCRLTSFNCWLVVCTFQFKKDVNSWELYNSHKSNSACLPFCLYVGVEVTIQSNMGNCLRALNMEVYKLLQFHLIFQCSGVV